MALISPILDDRSFAQLKEELVRRIPVYTQEWTDHNETDPGIALLELFAYLGESVLYRFNQIPETTKIEFLRLLGVQARPARPATAIIAGTTALAAGVQIPLSTAVTAGQVPFRTSGETYVWPLDCLAAGKFAAPDLAEPPAGDVAANARYRAEKARRDDAQARAGLTPPQTATFYVTEQLAADPGDPDAAALDVSATLDGLLWIAVLRQKATDLALLRDQSLFLGLAFDEAVDRPFDLRRLRPGQANAFRSDSDGLTSAPPPMVWKLWTGPDRDAVTLSVGSDTTRGLVTSGVVELLMPHRLPDLATLPPASGDKASPPPLADAQQAASVVAWLSVGRPAGVRLNDPIRKVRWAGLNAAPVVQSRVAGPELLGTGTGDAGQRYPLAQVRPQAAASQAGTTVLPGTTVLQVEEPDGWHTWQEVDSFVVSLATDRHYVVDYTGGAVEFGDVRVPQLGERIRTLSYEFCAGTAGNVPAGAIKGLADVGGAKVANPLPAAGGMDAASLTDALDAIPAEIHRRDRAVVAADFGDLARELTEVARAEPLPLLHPDNPAIQAAGVVSVVIFPKVDLTDPQFPLPGRDLLRQVAQYLDERRLVTTELYVIPPTYRALAVAIGLAVRPGYQVDAVRRWVDQLLHQYLAPLPPFGPDGAGWPIGRTVRRAELEAVVVQVEGVEYATGLTLALDDDGTYTEVNEVILDRWQVPQLTAFTVVAGDPLKPGEGYDPAPTGSFVPLPPDVC